MFFSIITPFRGRDVTGGRVIAFTFLTLHSLFTNINFCYDFVSAPTLAFRLKPSGDIASTFSRGVLSDAARPYSIPGPHWRPDDYRPGASQCRSRTVRTWLYRALA